MVRRRPVALKLLHPGLLENEQAYRDFLSQAGQAAELVHPHIAWVWESGEIDGHFFLVERFVNGPSLASKLSESGVLPWEQARQMVDQIAQALEFAFSKGWVHGRVTPHNILLGLDQTAVLSDYGLQRALRVSKISAMLQISTYDAQYLAPEVLQGKPVSPAADQYALACTLLEMLAGKNPFAADSLAEIEQKHLAPLVEPLFPTRKCTLADQTGARKGALARARRALPKRHSAGRSAEACYQPGRDRPRSARNARRRRWRPGVRPSSKAARKRKKAPARQRWSKRGARSRSRRGGKSRRSDIWSLRQRLANRPSKRLARQAHAAASGAAPPGRRFWRSGQSRRSSWWCWRATG